MLPALFFDPALTRRQIVIHSGVQFPEGDVFKWWHLASDGRVGLGQRTRASDPHLWLPYVLVRYVEATGDWSVLDERQPYLVGAAVPDGAMDLLLAPRPSRETGDVYDHCVRAIRYTIDRMGAHGLPLIGTGDWNDGIDAAGPGGRGEGTWLACFFFDIVSRFATIADHREGRAAGDLYRAEAARLAAAVDGVWTGDHYVFDFVDDGRPLDPPSIMAAAWPVLSGAAPLDKGRRALEHGLASLEKPDRILLVTPPFDEGSDPYPGRIADYPPGVRENGGQYSHGASWAVTPGWPSPTGPARTATPRAPPTPWRARCGAGAPSRRSARRRATRWRSTASRPTSSPPTSTTARATAAAAAGAGTRARYPCGEGRLVRTWARGRHCAYGQQ